MAKKTLPAPDGSSSTPTPDTPARKRTTRRTTASAAATGELAMAGAGMSPAELSAIVNATTDGHDHPAFHEIAEAAYLRYLQRGGQDGRDFDDWIEAERDLKRRAAR